MWVGLWVERPGRNGQKIYLKGLVMNNLVAATKKALTNYVNFSGRAGRPEFWWWVLAALIVTIIVRIVDGLLFAPLMGFDGFNENAWRPLSMLLGLALILPAIAVGVRRMHDIGKSGWWLLLGLVPIIGALVVIYFYAQKGDPDSNRFGAPEPFSPE